MTERKRQFFTKLVEILVHILTTGGLSAEPHKVRKIFDFQELKDKKQLQAFIEIVNDLAKFLPHLASVAAVLTDPQGTTCTCRWTNTPAEAFNQCKDLINSGEVITSWNSNSEAPKYFICDAREIGLGSWLGQGTLEKILPARFHCRKFNAAQLNYTTWQKELRGIIDYLKFFVAHLRVTKFTI